MSVRNFWVEVEIDGRKSILQGGPRSKGGGMAIKLYQRSEGEKTQPIVIDCRHYQGGMLLTSVFENGTVVFDHETIR